MTIFIHHISHQRIWIACFAVIPTDVYSRL